jgi:hypothetical protein
MKTSLAFLIAPVVPALAVGLGVGALSILPYSYAFSLLLGLPVFFILRSKRKETNRNYIIAGILCGFGYVAVPAIVTQMIDLNALFAASIFAGIGATTAITFSIIRGNEKRI